MLRDTFDQVTPVALSPNSQVLHSKRDKCTCGDMGSHYFFRVIIHLRDVCF